MFGEVISSLMYLISSKRVKFRGQEEEEAEEGLLNWARVSIQAMVRVKKKTGKNNSEADIRAK